MIMSKDRVPFVLFLLSLMVLSLSVFVYLGLGNLAAAPLSRPSDDFSYGIF